MKCKLILKITMLMCVLFLCGCSDSKRDNAVDKLKLTSEELFYNEFNTAKTIKVETIGKRVPGLLGGKGSAREVSGKKVLFKIDEISSSSFNISPLYANSDISNEGGEAFFTVSSSGYSGDAMVTFYAEENTNAVAKLRIISGVSLLGNKQELKSGKALSKDLGVMVVNKEGQPISGVDVYFEMVSKPGKSGDVVSEYVKTDEKGVATTNIKTDKSKTGIYKVSAQISGLEHNIRFRSVELTAMAMNPIGLIIAVLGGLALFIYGMTLMSDGLQQIAGSRLKAFLGYITRNRFAAILSGTIITALIQSSSATTVMTVGFVNAGLLTLTQSIGVIFGANIGTTITGQIVSLKLDGLSLPAIIIGVVGLLVAKKVLIRGVFRTVLGFGLLFFGMTQMSDGLGSVSSFPSFIDFFKIFDCTPNASGYMPIGSVLGAIAIGTVCTVVVQSSSATIGLTIVLVGSGLISLWTAIPIVLGDNIGTTITAVLASLNTQTSAKRTALAHALFNIIGTCIMVVLFYVVIDKVPVFFHVVNSFTPGNGLAGENVGRHVAMAHTIFNVSNVVILSFFIKTIAKICEYIIPDNEKEKNKNIDLEPHLLNTPDLALRCTITALAKMTDESWRAAKVSLHGYRSDRPVSADMIHDVENEVDEMQTDIKSYIVKLMRRKLNENQTRMVPEVMHCVNDAERISDLAFLIARRVAKNQDIKESLKLSDAAKKELEELMTLTQHIASTTINGLKSGVIDVADIHKCELSIKEMAKNTAHNHAQRMYAGECTPDGGMTYMEVVSALHSVARHIVNIAERVSIIAK